MMTMMMIMVVMMLMLVLIMVVLCCIDMYWWWCWWRWWSHIRTRPVSCLCSLLDPVGTISISPSGAGNPLQLIWRSAGGGYIFSGTFSIFLLQTFCSPLPQDMRELHGSFCAFKISMVGKAGTVESEFTSENMWKCLKMPWSIMKHLALSIQMQTGHHHGIKRNNIGFIGGIV